jgi:hypothetical protein
MNLVDVHILTMPGMNQDWFEQAMESLRNEPVNVFVVPGYAGDLSRGRVDGYAQGTAPFVSHVDADDYVLPGAFDVCLQQLNLAEAVVTRQKILYEDGAFSSKTRGGDKLFVFERRKLEHCKDLFARYTNTIDHALIRAMKPKQIQNILYVWRNHSKGLHHQWPQLIQAEKYYGDYHA